MATQIETVRQQIAGHVGTAHGAQVLSRAPSNAGARGREGVVLRSDVTSQLADAAEELGMSVAARKKLDKGEILKRKALKSQAANLFALTKVKDAYEQLPNLPSKDKLTNLVKQLQGFERSMLAAIKGGKSGTQARAEFVRELLRLLQHFNSDPTHQYAALQILREFVQKRKRKRVSASGKDLDVEDILNDIEMQFQAPEMARAVAAGYAAAKIAAESATPLGTDPASIREKYRDLLRKERDYGELYDELLKFDMEEKAEDVIDTFINIVGNDLSNVGPHTDVLFLRTLLTELGKLKKMKTLNESSKEVVDHVRACGELNNDETLDVYQTKLMSKFLHFTCRKSVSMTDAIALSKIIGSKNLQTLMVYYNEIVGLHDLVPDEVFLTSKARLQQKDMLRKYMSQLAADEAEQDALEEAGAEDDFGMDSFTPDDPLFEDAPLQDDPTSQRIVM